MQEKMCNYSRTALICTNDEALLLSWQTLFFHLTELKISSLLKALVKNTDKK